MEDFRGAYLRICKENYIEPQESVLERIQSLAHPDIISPGVLDLTSYTLTIGTCCALGKALSHDIGFSEMLLTDCMLNEEGVKVLLSGLCINTSLERLDLRGNNLSQGSANALGHFLKENHTLKCLCLEWNNLGVWEASFRTFCEGLATNTGLESLDLRNNQLNYVGAQELALALQSNKTLRSLDVRWNNIGLVGGKALNNAVQHSQTLVKCEVTGNNLPQELSNSIEQSVLFNEDRQLHDSMNRSRTKILAQEINELKHSKRKQMVEYETEMEQSRAELSTTKKSSLRKIGQLQNALQENKSGLNALRAKLDMTEASLALAHQKAQDQEKLIELSRKETSDVVKNYEAQLRKEREDRAATEDRLRMELTDKQEKLFSLEGEFADAESKIKNQQHSINSLKENVTQLKSDNRHTINTADQRLDEERRRQQQALQDQANLHQKMMEVAKTEWDDTERALRKRISELQHTNVDLEEQLSTQNANLIAERSNSDEALRRLRSQLQEEHQISINQLNERLRLSSTEKGDLQKQVASLSSEVTDAQAMRSATTVETEGLRRTIQSLQQQLASKDADMVAEVGRVRTDMQRRVNQLEEECMQHSTLREKIVELETKLGDQAGHNREIIEEKNKEIEKLSENLRRIEQEIDRMREDEAQRAAVLQSAIMNYVQGSKFRTHSPQI
ncbi:leucine-rich repeat-containing protein 45-like [Styela clava]